MAAAPLNPPVNVSGQRLHHRRGRLPPPGAPAPFSRYTTPEFWDDPHIAARMLEHHLDPLSDRASRRQDTIDRSVEWIRRVLGLTPGSRLLDLGCGPGRYAVPLARGGVQVLGVDVSSRSLRHLQEAAAAEALAIHTVHGSYLTAHLGTDHHAAILIFEDYCALSPPQRQMLLTRVRSAVRPGGLLLFDVTAAPRFSAVQPGRRAEVDLGDGFWAAEPYHGVHETWTYPELRLVLDRFIITTAEDERENWNWMQCLTPEEVSAELAAAGWTVQGLYGDVTGSAFRDSSPTFAVLAGVP